MGDAGAVLEAVTEMKGQTILGADVMQYKECSSKFWEAKQKAGLATRSLRVQVCLMDSTGKAEARPLRGLCSLCPRHIK
jgi:hypothetical protein